MPYFVVKVVRNADRRGVAMVKNQIMKRRERERAVDKMYSVRGCRNKKKKVFMTAVI